MVVRLELSAVSLVELVLEFDPVQPQGVQETLQTVHAHQYTDGHTHEYDESESDCEEIHAQGALEELVEEDQRQLGVGQRQGPETQLGRGVGHAAQHELDGFDHLVHEQLAERVGMHVFDQRLDATESLQFVVFGFGEQERLGQQHDWHAQ